MGKDSGADGNAEPQQEAAAIVLVRDACGLGRVVAEEVVRCGQIPVYPEGVINVGFRWIGYIYKVGMDFRDPFGFEARQGTSVQETLCTTTGAFRNWMLCPMALEKLRHHMSQAKYICTISP